MALAQQLIQQQNGLALLVSGFYFTRRWVPMPKAWLGGARNIPQVTDRACPLQRPTTRKGAAESETTTTGQRAFQALKIAIQGG